MSDNDKTQETEPDPAAEATEVEILEVVGVDDDIPTTSAVAGDDEVVFTLDAEAEADVAPQPKPTSTQEESASESELLQRLRADYDNLRKRVARERDDFQLLANSRLIEGLLPVLDNFDRALQVEVRSAADGAFRAGMVMIYDQLNEALQDQGLRRIDTVGKPFDPNLHDAVATDGESSAPVNTVVEEFQRGYIFQNRVLRPAMVKVSTNGGGLPSSERKSGGR